MESGYRELRYTYKVTDKDRITSVSTDKKKTDNDDAVMAGDIMREIMKLSSREISRCKQFDDGVMCIRHNLEQLDCNGVEEHSLLKEKMAPIRLIDKLNPDDELIVRVYEDNDNAGDIVPADGPLDIVYEDEDLIIINKPGDMVVHPSYAHYKDSLSNYLAGYYIKSGQNHVIRTVGRLDRETSGLVIFAKNRHAAALLAGQKENMSRRKEYLAICSGVFEQPQGTVNAPIRRRPDERMIREVHPDGKEAITHYKVEKQFEDYALVRLQLDTGRTHQIRVHMAHLGHPLLGDNFYGKEIPDNHEMTRAALHAGYIELDQPISGERIKIKADLPQDMRRLLDDN
ncbi:MAG: RluA family pseudouridine synthase [Butyrivibrio sp.]|uniref:RluA family pseudouridine synthase n=1 Tax=Butyrivibrio sp. TaxID=28121 RepID=UPI0025C13C22|nr:RluA family pseudouridine synthase [Butyrivibrio sp.]MBQ6588862.1 RluA family pseudouridine synthase [Butyrivibrio sp.]